VFDIGEVKETYYIAMAYIQGRTLASYVSADKPPAQDAVASIVRKVALAMQEAHRQGIVHRDLKPANIMIDQRKEPIVMDFGLACPEDTSDESRLTQDGALLGSPAYMSPEQLKGATESIGAASDIYSLGVVLYELLVGRLPFSGSGSTVAMIGRILTEQPTDLASLRADVDPQLVDICRKAMHKNPEHRFDSMDEFAQALTDYLKIHQDTATVVDSKSLRATDVSRIQLTEQSRLAKTLCESGQFAAALPILQGIVASPDSQGTKMGQWAKTMLPQVEAKVQQQTEAAVAPTQPIEDDVFAGLPDTAPAQPLKVAPAIRTASRRRAGNSKPVPKAAITSVLATIGVVIGVALIGVAAWTFWPDGDASNSSSASDAAGTDAAGTDEDQNSQAGRSAQAPPSSSEGNRADSSQSESQPAVGIVPEQFQRL
ncbi:MAG: serine/threonine protein kinase, partial [Pirellulales bacterium]|nr:serine/threonine protein kinase [Pirellulales bacterium]